MIERTKDITFGEAKYRIRKMTPQVGSWVAMQLMSYTLPTFVAMKMAQQGMALPANVAKKDMGESDFHNLQGHCLSVVDRYTDVAGSPIAQPVYVNGQFDPTVQLDLPDVLTLTAHALVFNMLSFFGDGVLKKIAESFETTYPDLKQFIAGLSTNSAGAQS